MRQHYEWVLPRCRVVLGERTAIMGILNVTPDSFSDGGRYFDSQRAIARGQEIESEGADILDIGGESTRPGSVPISEVEELHRVLPVIKALSPNLKIPVSVDTYRSNVARAALEEGAQIINDISGLRFDPALAGVVSDTRAGMVLMHSRGPREQLHRQEKAEDIVTMVFSGLRQSIETALTAGIERAAIVIDPGIGFGKTSDESLTVLAEFSQLSAGFPYPTLVGTSRKSFITRIVDARSDAREFGTAATVASAIASGAHVVRVHAVRQMRTVAEVMDCILQAQRANAD